MSQISRDEVAHLARLARLALTDDELDHYAGQLDAILTHVGQIQAVDVAGTPRRKPSMRTKRSDSASTSVVRSMANLP